MTLSNIRRKHYHFALKETMTAPIYDLNRPVHLGRRDVFVETAMELFRDSGRDLPAKKRFQRIDAVVYYLQSALEHATLAAKVAHPHPLENVFIHYIRAVLFYLYSARVILENEFRLKDAAGPLRRFLNPGAEAESGLNLTHGEQILQDVTRLFALAAEPFQNLRKTLVAALDDQAKARYTLAYENLRAHVGADSHKHHAITTGRTFCPVPEMRYGSA